MKLLKIILLIILIPLICYIWFIGWTVFWLDHKVEKWHKKGRKFREKFGEIFS